MDVILRFIEFILETFFQLFTFIFLIRLVLNWIQYGLFLPATQVIFRVTEPVIRPIQSVVKNIGHFESASALVIVLLTTTKIFLKIVLSGLLPHWQGLLLWSAVDIATQVLNFYIFTIIGLAILSWFANPNLMPVLDLMTRITAPLMRPLQRVIPRVGPFDFSALVAIAFLYLIQIIFLQPLLNFAIRYTL